MTPEHLIQELKTRNSYFYQSNYVKDDHIAKDAAIIAERMATLDSISDIRVGDFLRLKNGGPARRGHDRLLTSSPPKPDGYRRRFLR